MEKIDFIKKDDRESLGLFYIEKAIGFALDKQFGKSYEFIKEGLDVLTCDCMIRGRIKKMESKMSLKDDIENTTIIPSEYFFTKGYYLSFYKDRGLLLLALKAINEYLEHKRCDYGYYIKGNILIGLDNPEEALACYELVEDINPRINFKIGMTAEKYFSDIHGIYELYSSFLNNPSSVCCANILRVCTIRRGIKLQINEVDSENKILKLFMGVDTEGKTFFSEYSALIKEKTESNILMLANFLAVLKTNSKFYPSFRDSDFNDKEDDDWGAFDSDDDYYDAMSGN